MTFSAYLVHQDRQLYYIYGEKGHIFAIFISIYPIFGTAIKNWMTVPLTSKTRISSIPVTLT